MRLQCVSAVRCSWTSPSWRTIRSIRRWAEQSFSSTKPPAAQVSLSQTEEAQNTLINMKLSVRILFCLLCGALTAAQDLNWNFEPASRTLGDQKPSQPEVQEPAGNHRNSTTVTLFFIWWNALGCLNNASNWPSTLNKNALMVLKYDTEAQYCVSTIMSQCWKVIC